MTFTGLPGHSQWTEPPAWLKPSGDGAYCAGINRFILHRFAQQSRDAQHKAGATMGCRGKHFDRTQTWWESPLVPSGLVGPVALQSAQ